MKAVIFCNGEIRDYEWVKKRSFDNVLVICADGGLRHTRTIGVKPDIIIGDNDSWETEYSDSAEVFIYPPKKDFTDTQLCVDCAIERGCDEIEIIGGFGGRHDHEYSHYCLMAYALDMGIRLKMTDERNVIYMEDKPFVLKKSGHKYVSFFPYGGDVEGFSVKGLEYEADNMTLRCGLVQASSNEFADCETVQVDFKSGRLLVMLCND